MPLTPDQLRRLRHIEIRDPTLDLAGFPTFLIAGPPRTGTHWLATNLRQHPEVFLPQQIVELYYFSSLEHPPGDYIGLPEGVCRDLAWYLQFFRESPAEAAARQKDAESRFRRNYRRRVAGEATSVYALGISAAVLDDILLLAPDLKVVLTVRDPIERTWSNAKLELGTRYGRNLEAADPKEVERFVSDPYHRRCGDYPAMLAHWQPRLRPGHLLLRSFATAARDPAASLREVYRFLDVEDSASLVPAGVAEKVNSSADEPIPPRYRDLLQSLFGDQVAQLRRLGMLP
jgi:hypothetical protein